MQNAKGIGDCVDRQEGGGAVSLRTVTFTSLMNGMIRGIGMATTDPSATDKLRYASLLTEGMDYAWYWLEGGWPELAQSASRTASSNVISMERDVGNSILPIGQVLGVYERNPFTDKNPGPLPFSVAADGIVLNDDVGAAATVHVKFIEPAPIYTTTAWVTATAYVVGDVVYQSDECYLCVESHTSGTFSTDLTAVKWVVQPVPAFMAEVVKQAGVAALRESESQTQRMQVLTQVLDRKLAAVARRYEMTTSGMLRLEGSGVV